MTSIPAFEHRERSSRTLQALSEAALDSARGLARMAMNVLHEDTYGRTLGVMRKHAGSGRYGSGEVAELVKALETTEGPETIERRAKARERHRKDRDEFSEYRRAKYEAEWKPGGVRCHWAAHDLAEHAKALFAAGKALAHETADQELVDAVRAYIEAGKPPGMDRMREEGDKEFTRARPRIDRTAEQERRLSALEARAQGIAKRLGADPQSPPAARRPRPIGEDGNVIYLDGPGD